ncbi:GNAT family N-acetyltransferase, partial [Enterobacter hormaechei]|nr:GNAT family N-acetyltransferase [Enterobacter hormaechei]
MTNSNDSVTLRLMTEHDLAMLYEWLNRSHIVEWWGGEEARPTLADVQEQYLPSVLAQEGTVAKLAMRQPFVLFKGLTFQKLCL